MNYRSGAHDSPFLRDAADDFSLSGNQFYNSTVQLAAGVRLLSAQVQINATDNSLHVCHTSCDLLDAGKLSTWLSEVNTWLVQNPNDVVTVLLVNGADANASALKAEYQSAGISDIAYTHPATSTTSSTAARSTASDRPTGSSSEWPTLRNLIENGTRMVNFVAALPESSGFLMNEWDFIFENSYQNTAPTDYSCVPNRPSSVANNTRLALQDGMMALMNREPIPVCMLLRRECLLFSHRCRFPVRAGGF